MGSPLSLLLKLGHQTLRKAKIMEVDMKNEQEEPTAMGLQPGGAGLCLLSQIFFVYFSHWPSVKKGTIDTVSKEVMQFCVQVHWLTQAK